MNRMIILLLLGLIFTNCKSQSPNSKFTLIQNNEIKYQLDSSKWFIQKPKDLVEFVRSTGAEPQFKEREVVGLFTYNKFPVMNFPSIMILNTIVDAAAPPFDQLARELGASTLSLDDIEKANKIELSELVKDFEFKTPILIKEKRLMITETTAQITHNQTLKIRQSMFFRGKNVVLVQISYIEGKDEKYLADFYKIVETMEFPKTQE